MNDSDKQYSTPTPIRLAVIGLVGGIPALATFLAYLSPLWWGFDVLSHYRPQFAVLLGAVVVTCLLARRWTPAAFCAVPLALNLLVLAPFYMPRELPEAAPVTVTSQVPILSDIMPRESDRGYATPHVRVAQMNLAGTSHDIEPALTAIQNSAADVIVLFGVDDTWHEFLHWRISPYHIAHSTPRKDGFGIAIINRLGSISDLKVPAPKIAASSYKLTTGRLNVPAIEARIKLKDRQFTLLACQMLPARSRSWAAARERQADAVVDWVNAQTGPAMVVTAANATPWSQLMQNLVDRTGLVNTQKGFGLQPTWPASGGLPLNQIAVDHVLVTPDLWTLDRRLGESGGGDHFALLTDVTWVDAYQNQ